MFIYKFKRNIVSKDQILNNNISTVSNRGISKIIIQTFRDSVLEEYLQNNVDMIKNLNPTYEYLYFSDNDCIQFLQHHFNPIVYQSYCLIKPGAFKADLFRYCALYIFGGIYLDIKILPLISFENIIIHKMPLNLTRERDVIDNYGYKQWGNMGYVYNGFMASEPFHPVLLELITICVNNILAKRYNECCLSVTGPGIFRNLSIDINEYKIFQFDYDAKYIKYNFKNILKVKNKTYRKNENYDFLKTYSGMWYNKNIYI